MSVRIRGFKDSSMCSRKSIKTEWRIYASVNKPSLVQIMAWRLVGAKPLSEPMLNTCIINSNLGNKLQWHLKRISRGERFAARHYIEVYIEYSISQEICTRFCCALLCCGYAIVIMNSHEVFIHIHQGCFAGTGAIVRLPQCQWSKPDGYGKSSQCITTTKHSKAKTVCIFLGIYCMSLKITLQKGIQIWKYYGHSLMFVPASVFFIYFIVIIPCIAYCV